MTIYRGGTDEERLYLHDLKFDCGDDICIVRATDMPDLKKIIARHQARYAFASSFCTLDMKVLDFPCGSGYGSVYFTGNEYEGRDSDIVSLEYAKNFYLGSFTQDDLAEPHLPSNHYDLIVCIEGLEHIEQKYQDGLIKAFHDALKRDGTLIVTSPEKRKENNNPYHKHELSLPNFDALLRNHFKDVQTISIKNKNHKGELTNFIHGICRKGD